MELTRSPSYCYSRIVDYNISGLGTSRISRRGECQLYGPLLTMGRTCTSLQAQDGKLTRSIREGRQRMKVIKEIFRRQALLFIFLLRSLALSLSRSRVLFLQSNPPFCLLNSDLPSP
jgi:hypothetical protein